MNCNKFQSDLIMGFSNKKMEEHLAVCAHCTKLHMQVEETMHLLDMSVPAPEGLVASIMKRKEKVVLPRTRRLNLSSFIQIAAAIMFGIFIGHKFGQIANEQSPKVKQDPVSQYFKAHHFNIDNNEFNSSSFFITN